MNFHTRFISPKIQLTHPIPKISVIPGVPLADKCRNSESHGNIKSRFSLCQESSLGGVRFFVLTVGGVASVLCLQAVIGSADSTLDKNRTLL